MVIMAQGMIACPLCSAPSFSNTNSLCLTLVSITSKRLHCTLCEEELNGLDKFTLHLLNHLIQNSDFKRFLVNDLFPPKVSPSIDKNIVSSSEPLNLVKDATICQHLIQQIEDKTSSKQFDSASQKNITNLSLNERPSLKIDDEVMIFFNPNETLKKPYDEPGKPLERNLVASCTEAPKCSLHIKQHSQNQNRLTSVDNRNNAVSTDENIDVLSHNDQENLYFSPDRISDTSCNETLVFKNKKLLDLSCENKKENLKKRPLDTSEVLKINMNESEAIGFKNKPCIKSSFLSPKGERVLGFRCDICSLVFPDEHIMSMHRQLIHIELSGDPLKTNRFKCHLCSKSFAMRGSLMVHMRVAHFGGAVVARLVESKQLETNAVSPDSAQFNCSICNKGFNKEHQLTQHEKLHDGKQCDICFKTFTTKYFLRKHKRLHTGEMPYTCNICNKSFTFQQSYHKHLLYHSDEKPYSCVDCGRAFKELSTLHNHQRIHTGEKPFSCETCGKCFRQRVSYLVHRRIHTGLMPYKCKECGKKFRYKVSERTHKCTLFNPGPITDSADTTVSEGNQENICADLSNECFQKLHEATGKEASKCNENLAGDHVMSDSYPEPSDFFSLVMSPADRLQNLSLSGEETDTNGGQDSIDSEALKQLLYDVADYT